jgi:hypothetical protein
VIFSGVKWIDQVADLKCYFLQDWKVYVEDLRAAIANEENNVAILEELVYSTCQSPESFLLFRTVFCDATFIQMKPVISGIQASVVGCLINVSDGYIIGCGYGCKRMGERQGKQTKERKETK